MTIEAGRNVVSGPLWIPKEASTVWLFLAFLHPLQHVLVVRGFGLDRLIGLED